MKTSMCSTAAACAIAAKYGENPPQKVKPREPRPEPLLLHISINSRGQRIAHKPYAVRKQRCTR